MNTILYLITSVIHELRESRKSGSLGFENFTQIIACIGIATPSHGL
jgi:hypothetical protein